MGLTPEAQDEHARDWEREKRRRAGHTPTVGSSEPVKRRVDYVYPVEETAGDSPTVGSADVSKEKVWEEGFGTVPYVVRWGEEEET